MGFTSWEHCPQHLWSASTAEREAPRPAWGSDAGHLDRSLYSLASNGSAVRWSDRHDPSARVERYTARRRPNARGAQGNDMLISQILRSKRQDVVVISP